MDPLGHWGVGNQFFSVKIPITVVPAGFACVFNALRLCLHATVFTRKTTSDGMVGYPSTSFSAAEVGFGGRIPGVPKAGVELGRNFVRDNHET